ncbi:SDR family oxidoreductase [Xanthobacter sp. KR7-65]|uniref:SDR family oxidoreductase n=1 Tax=Xanthobacter sp. KR7-65 TaxID=3156612 RepID=UPI0032B5735F
MRVFVTGATGFIGSAVVGELVAAGHEVLGLARSPDKAAAIAAAGAEVHHGSLEEPESLANGAARCDGVIHLAFNHDFSRYVANCEDDRRIIATLGAALADTGRPLIVTTGAMIAHAAPGVPARESDPPLPSAVHPRAATDEAAAALVARGGNVSVVRLPQVHDTARQGLVSYAIGLFRQKGVCSYVGEGANVWSAGHVSDVARLYRLAIEKAKPGAIYHAVGEEGVSLRDIVGTVGRRLALPVASIAPAEADAQFGWLASFMKADAPASSDETRKALGWQPTGPGLLVDLAALDLTQA